MGEMVTFGTKKCGFKILRYAQLIISTGFEVRGGRGEEEGFRNTERKEIC